MVGVHPNLNGLCDLTTPHQGWFVTRGLALATINLCIYRAYELLWARIGNTVVGALYHPPRPLYTTDSLLDYIEACLDELFSVFPSTFVVVTC